MAEKRAARRAKPEPFVHRIDPSGGGGFRMSLTVAAMAYTPTLLILLIGAVVEIFGSFFANHWPTVVIVGALNTVVVLMIKAATAAKNQADSEGIALILDGNGVYLGGRQPRRIAWSDISEVRLTTLTTTHVRTGRTAIHHYADFEITGSRRARRTGLDATKLRQIRATVTRHAPTVKITVLDQRR